MGGKKGCLSAKKGCLSAKKASWSSNSPVEGDQHRCKRGLHPQKPVERPVRDS